MRARVAGEQKLVKQAQPSARFGATFGALRSRGRGHSRAHFSPVYTGMFLRDRHRTLARFGEDSMAGAALARNEVQMLFQVQRFRTVMAYFVAGAAVSQSRAQISRLVQISRQAQHFRRVRYMRCGRRYAFAR